MSFADLAAHDIPALAGTMVSENNIEQLRALRQYIQELPSDMRKEHMNNALNDFLLEKDERLGVATRVLDSRAIAVWVEGHVETVVKQCPRLFGRYAQPNARYMYWLGHHHANLDEASKVDILQGKSTDGAHRFMREALKNDPSLWNNLTPIWFGANMSPLRQAATDLGWRPNVMTGFFSKTLRARQVNEWGAVLAYPHSTAVVVAVLLQDHHRHVKQRLSNSMGAHVGWAGVEPCSLPLTRAHRWDSTLAALLVEKTKYPYMLGEHAPKEVLEPHEMEFLRGVVDMHVGVGCLELLLHGLEQERLPGEMLGMQEGLIQHP